MYEEEWERGVGLKGKWGLDEQGGYGYRKGNLWFEGRDDDDSFYNIMGPGGGGGVEIWIYEECNNQVAWI